MYKQFWGISSIDQGQFVVDRVLSGINKQITAQENSQRSQTWNYFLDKNTEKRTERIQVCRNIFYETLQVKETFVRCALQASKMGVAKKDQRGTNAPKHKMSQAEKKGIQDYINIFPKVESHYIKKESKKIFIAGTSNFNKLAITRMYDVTVKCVSPVEPGQSLMNCIKENSKPFISLFTSQRGTSARHAPYLITKHPQNMEKGT